MESIPKMDEIHRISEENLHPIGEVSEKKSDEQIKQEKVKYDVEKIRDNPTLKFINSLDNATFHDVMKQLLLCNDPMVETSDEIKQLRPNLEILVNDSVHRANNYPIILFRGISDTLSQYLEKRKGKKPILINDGFLFCTNDYKRVSNKNTNILKIVVAKNTPILYVENLDFFLLGPTTNLLMVTFADSFGKKTASMKTVQVTKQQQTLMPPPSLPFNFEQNFASKKRKAETVQTVIDGQTVTSEKSTKKQKDHTAQEMTNVADVMEIDPIQPIVEYDPPYDVQKSQEEMIPVSVPNITKQGHFYFGMNRDGISRKLATCDWDRRENIFSFPSPGRRNALIISVDDKYAQKSFIIKAFYKPHKTRNGNLVEAIIYTKLIANMKEYNMTRHLVTPFAHIRCPNFMESVGKLLKESPHNIMDKEGKWKRFTDRDLERRMKSLLKGIGIEETKNTKRDVHLLCLKKLGGQEQQNPVFSFAFVLLKFLKGEALTGKDERVVIEESDIKAMLFQILYTIHIFIECGLQHNELHTKHILVKIKDHSHPRIYTIDGKHYSVGSRFKVYIIDFSRSFVVQSPLLRSDKLALEKNPFGDGTILSYRTRNWKHKTINPKFDAFFFLLDVYMHQYKTEKFDSLYNQIEKWISPTLLMEFNPRRGSPKITDIEEFFPDRGGDNWVLPVKEMIVSDYFNQFVANRDWQPKFEFSMKDIDVVENILSRNETSDKNSFLSLLQLNEDLIRFHTPSVTLYGAKLFNIELEKISHSESHKACDVKHFREETVSIPREGDINTIFSIHGMKQVRRRKTGVKLQVYRTPSPLNNGPLVESIIYTDIVFPLLISNVTPHVVKPYSHYICTQLENEIYWSLGDPNRKLWKDARDRIWSEIEKDVGYLVRNEYHVLCLGEIENVVSLHEFLKTTQSIKNEDLQSIVFQILYTLFVFNQSGLRHNNLSLYNIMIQKLETPRNNSYKVEGKEFTLDIIYHVYIINFDKSSVNNSSVLKRMSDGTKSPLRNGNLRNTTIENIKYQLDKVGMFNRENPKADVLQFLYSLHQVLPNISQYGLDLGKWVSGQILDDDNVYRRINMTDHQFLSDNEWIWSVQEMLFSPYFANLTSKEKPVLPFEFMLENINRDKSLHTINTMYNDENDTILKLIKYHTPHLTDFGWMFKKEFPKIHIDFKEVKFPKPGMGNSILMEFKRGGQDCILKMFYRSSPLDSSPLVEAIFYNTVVVELLTQKMTPHLPKSYFHIITTTQFKNDLVDWNRNNKAFEKKLEEMVEYVVGDNDEFHTTYYPNSSYIEKKNLSEIHLLCIEKISGGKSVLPLYSYLQSFREKKIDEKHFKSILFQILYTLYIFNRAGIRHNDLHGGNVLVKKLEQPVYHKYIVDVGNESVEFYLTLHYMVYVIDFDRVSVNNSELLKKKYQSNRDDPLSTGNLKNTILESIRLCYKYGTCNKKNEKADTFKLLYELCDIQHFKNVLENWISWKYFFECDKR